MVAKKQNIENIAVDRLIPYSRNSRTHSDKQVNQIATSITEFGFTSPILIDEQNEVIAGHGRLMAAKKLNLKEVPCLRLSLTDNQRRAYVIADNKLAENAGWDEEMLALELNELIELDFDVSITGFSDKEIGKLFDDITAPTEITSDDMPSIKQVPTSKLSDTWLLGDHRLMCGDATCAESINKLMGEGGGADMLFTDPPYLMDFSGGMHADGSKSFSSSHGAIKNDKMSKKDGDLFLDSINKIIKSVVKGAFYITFYRLGIDRYYQSLERTGLRSRSLIIWDKGSHTLSNSDYMSMYEPIFYGWVKEHIFFGGNNGMDIWKIPRTKKNELHPTMKPVELVEKAIKHGSMRGQTVLDMFGGSGTTLIACERLQRKALVMELDEKYVDVIINRWQNETGKEAVCEKTGKTYNQITVELNNKI